MDHHRIHHHWVVLSRHRTPRSYLHDRPRVDLHLARPLLVWQRMSARQHVRPFVVEILTTQADSRFCAHLRLPPVHGVFHLRNVRHPADVHRSLERRRVGYVEWYRSRVLDNHCDDHHCRCYAEFHLCAAHLVFVLSDGNHIFMGSAQAQAPTPALYRCACFCRLPNEM